MIIKYKLQYRVWIDHLKFLINGLRKITIIIYEIIKHLKKNTIMINQL